MDADTIDSDISRWILEFLIRQPLDDGVLGSLLRVLPLSDHDHSLKKSLLLRKIESEVSNGVVSEKILTLLEQIEELDHSLALETSDALKSAYCAVAVDCTVRFLENDGVNGVKGGYFDAVKRIWKRRVSVMEKFGNVGLVSEGLLEWKDEIEAALWEESACENVVRRSRGVNAVEAVRVYVNGEKGKMGASFLEYIAETLKWKRGGGGGGDGDAVLGVIGWGEGEKHDHVPEKAAVLPSCGAVAAVANASREVPIGNVLPTGNIQPNGNVLPNGNILPNGSTPPIGNVLPRRKHVACKGTRVVASGASRGAKIADIDEMGVGPSCSKYDVLATPDVNKVQKMLESSRLELQAVVKDPLPDALRIADTVLSGMASRTRDQEPLVENQDRVNPSDNAISGVAQSSERNVGNGHCTHQTNAPRPSLMERNSTARTFEWDDSLDGSPESLTNHYNRPHLSSPRRRPVSPLRKYEVQKVTKRRKSKRWSNLEEDTLRTGVKEFGVGNWKLILNSYRDTFEERTEVDLKDKWRNLTRSG